MNFDKRNAVTSKTHGGVLIKYPFREEWKSLLAPGVLDLLLLKFGKDSEPAIKEAVQEAGRRTFTEIDFYLRQGDSTAC